MSHIGFSLLAISRKSEDERGGASDDAQKPPAALRSATKLPRVLGAPWGSFPTRDRLQVHDGVCGLRSFISLEHTKDKIKDHQARRGSFRESARPMHAHRD